MAVIELHKFENLYFWCVIFFSYHCFVAAIKYHHYVHVCGILWYAV